MRNLLTSLEFSSDEAMGILELAKDMKENPSKYSNVYITFNNRRF